MSLRSYVNQYRQNDLEGTVTDASPHKLVSLLLRGACDRVRLAQQCMEQGELARKGKAIGEACAIVGHLNGSLDHEAGGELAGNLASLYDYIVQRLTEANLHNDQTALGESLDLLGEIDSAWNAIPQEHRTPVGMAR